MKIMKSQTVMYAGKASFRPRSEYSKLLSDKSLFFSSIDRIMRVFDDKGSFQHISKSYEPCREKICFLQRKKDADQLLGNHAADQHLCFLFIVQSLYSLNLKFQAFSHFLWLYSPFCCGTGVKSQFSHDAAHILWLLIKYPYRGDAFEHYLHFYG